MDEATAQALIEGTRGALLGYLRQACGQETLAEDLFQEACIRLLNHPPADQDPRALRAWLFTTATRLLHDHWRSEKRRRWWPFHREDDEADWEPPSLEPPPDTLLATRQLVALGLKALPPRQRTLLWLAHVEGLDHETLARTLDLSRGSVKVLLHRARTRMAQVLADLGVEGGTP